MRVTGMKSLRLAAGLVIAVAVGLSAPTAAVAIESPQSGEEAQSGMTDSEVEDQEANGDSKTPADQSVSLTNIEPEVVADITINPLEGEPGATLSIAGQCSLGDRPATRVRGELIKLDAQGSPSGESYAFVVTPKYDPGVLTFDVEFKVPGRATPGTYEVEWSCGGSIDTEWATGKLDSLFTVLPSTGPPPIDHSVAELDFAPLRVRPGATIEISGRCLSENGDRAEDIRGFVVRKPITPGQAASFGYVATPKYVGNSDMLKASFRVPNDLRPGAYSLSFTCGDLEQTWSHFRDGIDLEILSEPVDLGDTSGLAETGFSPSVLNAAGVMTAVGIALLVASRVRKKSTNEL